MMAIARSKPEVRETVEAVAQGMGNGRNAAAIAEGVAAAGALMDRRLPMVAERQHACKKGCSYCCHVIVDVSIAEVARALEVVARRFSAEDVAALTVRARENADRSRGTDALSYPIIPCAFLRDGECSIYEGRPLACRGEHSLDVTSCRQAYEAPLGEDVDGERDLPVVMTSSMIRFGLDLATRDAGFPSGSYELQQAVAIALEQPGALERWLAGDDAFGSASRGRGLVETSLGDL